MKAFLVRAVLGVLLGLIVFGVAEGGVWLDSFMTVRTPFYYTFQYWVAVIMATLIGSMFILGYEK